MDVSKQDGLKSTELTAVIGREKFDELGSIIGRERWNIYRDLYEKASNLEIITDYPIQIDFELNASCNMRCPMCPISAESAKGKGPKTWFPISLYKELVEDGVKRGLKAIKLNYVNEPLIRKDLIDFIAYAKEVGVLDIYLSTNGLLLSESMAKNLILAGLTRIQISIDAHTSVIYDQVRPGGNLEKIQKNIINLMALKNKLGSILPLVRVNFVRTELNEHELGEFMEYWSGRVDMIGVQEFVKPPISSHLIVSKTSEKKRERGFRCSFPFKQVVITNEKKILPCCTFWGEHLALEQNCVDSESVIKAWNSPGMNSLREMHLKGEYWKSEICKKCVDGGLVD